MFRLGRCCGSLLLLSLLCLVASCRPAPIEVVDASINDTSPDVTDSALPCSPLDDADSDGLNDVEEGCPTRDSDGDGTPDYQDLDSDDDGIYDRLELGAGDVASGCLDLPKAGPWPCDTDGDGKPDYLDTDSDDDGVLDGDEDRNGDGMLGCCAASCGLAPSGRCPALEKGECSRGQECVDGNCWPPVDLLCMEGETDAKKASTFDDVGQDGLWGGWRCEMASNPAFMDALYAKDWGVSFALGLEYAEYEKYKQAARDVALAFALPNAVEAAAVARGSAGATLQETLDAVVDPWRAATSVASVTVTSKGISDTSVDGFETQRYVVLDVTTKSPTSSAALRSALLGQTLGDDTTETYWDEGRRDAATSFEVHLSLWRAFLPNEPSNAPPPYTDSGEESAWHSSVAFAVVAADSQAPKSSLDDVSSGFVFGAFGYVTPRNLHCDLTLATEQKVELVGHHPVAGSVRVFSEGAALVRGPDFQIEYGNVQAGQRAAVTLAPKHLNKPLLIVWLYFRYAPCDMC